ncbi:unnamed protein product [Gongylonema pulchrum]|uniref:Alpha-carbonic anhydrase domain-containing protein n=1 Tax=Gongylonema pulchrum TaxID=637853 RepID=A0A183ETX6_9BILA|nr:unnamed protein product [Gongylonema pulchrum]
MVVAVCVSRVLSVASPSSSLSELPGYADFDVQPELATASRHGSFVFGRASKPVNRHAFVKIPLGDGKTMQVPKGIFHYAERSQHFDTDAAVPQLEHPFKASGAYKSQISNVNGIYLPMPFGMDPINLQLLTEHRTGRSVYHFGMFASSFVCPESGSVWAG